MRLNTASHEWAPVVPADEDRSVAVSVSGNVQMKVELLQDATVSRHHHSLSSHAVHPLDSGQLYPRRSFIHYPLLLINDWPQL